MALGVPLVIHLLTRRTHRTVTLPTFRFLQSALAQQSQVFKLRRLLLLALRMALLLFLVLTFLKPTRTAPLAARGGRRAVVVVLDHSLSMGYTQGGVESLARVRSEATALLDDLRPGDIADLHHAQTVVLLTDEALNGSPTGAYFLSRALNPVPDQPGGIRVLARHATELTEADLKTSDAVLLEAVTTMPADRLPMLANYVANGGTLLVFAGGPNFIGQMQALAHLGKNGDGLAFLPQSALDVSQRGKGYLTLTEARYDSPLLKLFKSPDAADLGKIHFTRLFLTTEPDKRAEVLLKYEDGTPAAARRNFGAGSILLCNFSTSPADSDLPRQEFFPPLLHEFLKGLTDRGSDRRELFPGGSASTTVDADQVRGSVACLDPNSEPERVTVDKPSGGVIVERVDRIGFHAILANGQPVATLAVNPHPDESDLRAIDPRELQSKRAKHAAYAVHAGAVGAASELDSLRHDRPLWPWCLLAVLLLLLLEHAVAAFGGQARLRPAPPAIKL